MSCLNAGISVYGSNDFAFKKRVKGSFRVCSSMQTLQSNPRECLGQTLDLLDQKHDRNLVVKADPISANASISSEKWWEKWLHPNMIEIESAQQLVDSLLNGGERLVVVGFYSPDCGGCRTLHPKICQLAEMNSDALFLQVNYENHKELCCALNVHVLPFFRFYRSPEGKVCSFSCTNATIKKFKDAMGKHGSRSRCLGSSKGLDESELSALASRGLISRNPVPMNEVRDLILRQPGVFTNGDDVVRFQ